MPKIEREKKNAEQIVRLIKVVFLKIEINKK